MIETKQWQVGESKNRWSDLIFHYFSERYCMPPLITEHRTSACNCKVTILFICSFVKVLWKTNCELLKTLLLCFHHFWWILWDGINRVSPVAICNNVYFFLYFCTSLGNFDFLTCFHIFELLLELLWGEAVLIKSVVPSDSLQHLQVTTHQPITSLHNHLHKATKRDYQFLLTCNCSYSVSHKITALDLS